jgi:hypothetical protein
MGWIGQQKFQKIAGKNKWTRVSGVFRKNRKLLKTLENSIFDNL